MTSWFKCWPWVLGWVNVFLSQQCLLAVWVVTPQHLVVGRAEERRSSITDEPWLAWHCKASTCWVLTVCGALGFLCACPFLFPSHSKGLRGGCLHIPKAYSVRVRWPGSPSVRKWTQAWLSLKSMLITASQKFLWKVLMQLAPVTWQRFCSHSQCANVGWMSPWTVSFFTYELGVTLGWNRRWWGTIPILNVRGVLAIEMVGFIFMTQPARGRKPSPKIWFF